MQIYLTKPKRFEIHEFKTGNTYPKTLLKGRILDVVEITDAYIVEQFEDSDKIELARFCVPYIGYYLILSEMFDTRKYWCDDSDVFVVSKKDCEIVK